ncbi:MAG: EAL domain-containing protein [Mycobacteriales bacterium]
MAPSWVRRPVAVPVAVALAVLALLTAVGWMASNQASRAVRSGAAARVSSNRDAVARALVHQTDDFRRSLSVWAADPAVVAGLRDPSRPVAPAVQEALSSLARGQGSPSTSVTDLRGHLVARYPAQPTMIGQDLSYRDWFKGVSRTGRMYVSESYRSTAPGSPLAVAVAAPVMDRDRRVGYLTALWPLASIHALARGAHEDGGVTVTVTDQTGRSLTGAPTLTDRGHLRAAVSSSGTEQALVGWSSSAVYDGVLQAAGPVPGIGWTVTAAQATAVAYSSARTFVRSLEGALAVALVLVLGFAVLALVVARRRAAEQRAADEERHRLTALFAASPIGIAESLPDSTLVAVNDALAAMLGCSRDVLLGQTADDLTLPGWSATERLAGLLEGRTSGYTGEQVLRAADGSRVPVLVSVLALRDGDGEVRRLVAFVVDQREQRAASDALRALTDRLAEREAFLSTLFDTIDVAVIACDEAGVPTLVNHQARAVHGIAEDSPPDVFGGLRLAHLDGTPMEVAETPLARALTEDEVRDVELLVVTDDDRPQRRLLTHARRLAGPHGETVGAVVAAHDVTRARAAEEALRASEERFRRVFDEGLTGKLLVSADGAVTRVNATLCRLLGHRAEDLVGRPLVSCLEDLSDRRRVQELIAAGTGELRAEMAMSDAKGGRLSVLVALSWLTEHQGRRLLLVQLEDVTARRAAELRLTELALRDELTGLPNRRLLLERCERAFTLARSGRRESTGVAALFVDLDGFKPVNDTAGHEAGDRLLVAVAHDLQAVVRPADTVARVGGDEFVVLLEGDDGLDYVRSVADRVIAAVRRQVTYEEVSLTVSASVGIARVDLAQEPDVRPDQLLRRADAAMYRAKERGRDRHDVFDTELRERTEARQLLERSIRDGLREDLVRLVFQPVIDVDRGVVVGAEALMRLSTAEGRLLPTLPSIVAAEAAGLTEALGDRVMDLALDAAETWPGELSVAVNVSARELTSRDMHGRVERALERHDVDPARLVLEITESSILSAGPGALAELDELRHRGVRIAIDDFGTAYATLQNLTRLPVDILKVDASFTAGLPGQRTHTAIVHGVASMAYELGIPCVVEGVETEQQLEALRGLSLQAQGWLWGLPQGPERPPELHPVPVPPPRPG